MPFSPSPMLLLAIGLILIIVFVTVVKFSVDRKARKVWNGGRCEYCDQPWREVAHDYSGAKLYGCDCRTVWILYA